VKRLRFSKRLLAGAAAVAFLAGGSTALMPAAAHAQPAVPWGAKITPGVPVVGSFVVDGKRYPVYRPRVPRRDAEALLAGMHAQGGTSSPNAGVKPADYLTDQMLNGNSFKCLEVYNWGTSNGDQVDQWSCGTPQQANQTWEWQLEGSISLSGGSGECCDIFELVNQHSGKCLEAYNWGTTDKTKIDQWTCYTDANQEWLEDPGIACYQTRPFYNWNAYLQGKPSMVFEVYQQSKANGAVVDLYQDNGGANQTWSC
jgi:Ricin-type beta-trefoil lectin domain-like